MVNTFVISGNVKECAKALDYRRLGKQRVEAMQIHNALTNVSQSKSWKNHPATRAWKGYENALVAYMNEMILEWIARGYHNTMEMPVYKTPVEWPWWFHWPVLHNSHKASLNRKDSSFYKFEVDKAYMSHGYVWPSNVPEKWKLHPNPPLDEVCAPVQGLSSAKKSQAKANAKAKEDKSGGTNDENKKKVKPDKNGNIKTGKVPVKKVKKNSNIDSNKTDIARGTRHSRRIQERQINN